jgi:molybdenum cofactor biosynthesis enzyme MoaA
MPVRQQTVSPKQFEVIDDEGKLIGCHDSIEAAAAADVERAKINKNRGQSVKEAKT